jgi:hypothetical protein
MAYGRSNHPGSTTILVATEFKEGCLGGQLGGRFEHDSGFELESSAIVNKCHREQAMAKYATTKYATTKYATTKYATTKYATTKERAITPREGSALNLSA